jgi:diguanylate cyclase (GGDEF)-like protein/PAS domain S-box-containing protein
LDKKILRLLIVDASPDDADLPANILRKNGYMLKTQRVQDMAGMQAALAKGNWDVVLSEYNLPHFGAILALDTLKHSGQELPFIVLTKSIDDNDLAKAMRAGARDVILKSDLARLPAVIERELSVIEERQDYQKTSERLREIENKHQAMIDGSLEAISYSHDGMHVDANKAYLQLFGYEDLEELEGIPVLDLIDKSDHHRFKEYFRRAGKKDNDVNEPQTFTATRKDGSRLPVEVSMSTVSIGGEKCTQVVVSDMSRLAANKSQPGHSTQPETLSVEEIPVKENPEDDQERDTLTGVYKRDYFLREIARAIEQVKSGGKNSALLYLELDGLKKINDEIGSSMGDRLLREIGKLFKNTLDSSAVLSRFGGDEFAVLLEEDDPDAVQLVADTLAMCVRDATSVVVGNPNAAHLTLGLVMMNETVESVEKILSLAYSACEQAKKQQKTASGPAADQSTAEAAKDPEYRRLAAWRQRIQRALDDDNFRLAYQPVINLIGDPSEYYEVLVRLPGSGDDLISAAEFMPIAEESGQINAIDEWVVRNALSGLADLHSEGQKACFFVNLSVHAPENEALVPLIRQVLQESKLEARHLILEIDESLIDKGDESTRELIRSVHKLGCRLSLDNFGGRLAALDKLRDLPIEFLKIDGGLVRDCAHDNIKQMVLKTIVQIAKLLDRKTIGKCVEDEETLSLLYSYELDYLQGNYFQQADNQPEYKFGNETTLSSDTDDLGAWPPPR